jgi:RNA polymerase sigma-70 factor (ECF subfamily)
MGSSAVGEAAPAGFADFVHEVEPRLRVGLVATYGPADGREATVDALSWAWEHWDELQRMNNPAGYLYRVGQSAVRRFAPRPIPHAPRYHEEQPMPSPELVPALARLSEQQRTVVLLVHGFGWSQRDVASMLDLSASTVREHLSRALARLRRELEATRAH